MRAGPLWVMLAGRTQASIVISSLAVTASMTLVAAPADWSCVLWSMERPP